MKKTYKIDVDFANCTNKMEVAANETAGVAKAPRLIQFQVISSIVASLWKK